MCGCVRMCPFPTCITGCAPANLLAQACGTHTRTYLMPLPSFSAATLSPPHVPRGHPHLPKSHTEHSIHAHTHTIQLAHTHTPDAHIPPLLCSCDLLHPHHVCCHTAPQAHTQQEERLARGKAGHTLKPVLQTSCARVCVCGGGMCVRCSCVGEGCMWVHDCTHGHAGVGEPQAPPPADPPCGGLIPTPTHPQTCAHHHSSG